MKMTKQQSVKFVTGYNQHAKNLTDSFRRNSKEFQGAECARRTILRSQIEHNITPNPPQIVVKDIPAILLKEEENDKWFTKQANI